jgi:Icc-related predicted phosphoesterase
MRIIAFTDLHGHKKAVEHLAEKIKSYNVELAVCAGDISVFGNYMKDMLAALDKLSVPVLLIHGNHDEEEEIAELVKEHKNIIWLHKEAFEYKNFTFLGFGGGGFSDREPEFPPFAIKHQKKKNIVLVTHQPPFATTVDELGDYYVGNHDFRDFIDKVQPIVAICGHVHENANKHDIIEKTFVINPGPLGRVLELEENDTKEN